MNQQSFLNGHITFHSRYGDLSISFPTIQADLPETWKAIQNATTSVDYRLGDKVYNLILTGPDVSLDIDEDQVTLSQHNDHLRLDWNWTTVGDALEGWLEVANHGDAPLQVDRLHVLCVRGALSVNLPGPAADWRIYLNGWQSQTPAGVRRVGDGPFPPPRSNQYQKISLPHGDESQRHKLQSAWVAVITATAKKAGSYVAAQGTQVDPSHLLVGFVTGADQLAEIILDVDDDFHSLTATCHADGWWLEPGESLRSERLRVATSLDGWQSLEAWAGRMGELMDARVPDSTPTGWCTRHYYFGFNSAQDVYANLAAIRRRRLPLGLVMIDDGYQSAVGDWLKPNSERITDMAAVAATLRREGRVPGIWTAPFGLAADSQTWSNHPDWVIRDEAGQPVLAWEHLGQPVYALDTTHPDAAEWLDFTFRTLRNSWGYDAFMVDFLFAAALPGQRHNPRATRAQALRQGLGLIRQAIGDDAFLLGCGAPLGPAVGLVDGLRIGPDVGTTWESALPADLSAPGTANALRNNIARAYTHRRLWAAEPACLTARPRGDSSQLTLYETRTLAAIIALTGGMVLDSDQVANLPPSRLTILRQMLPPTDRIAVPLDFFEHDLPEILILSVERPWGRWWLAGLINWEDSTRSPKLELTGLGIPPDSYHMYDQWRASYLGQTDGSLTLPPQRPHETLVLLFKQVIDQPDWLTSTFHLAAGTVEVTDVIRQKLGDRRLKLVVHLEQEGENFGRLVFTVPAGWIVLDAQVNGRRRSVNVRDRSAGLVDMGFTLRNRAWVMVDFARIQ